MCLAALAIDQSRRFPLVVATNRDESFDRPTAPLDWWTPAAGDSPILAGRDLQAGGTWMGLSLAGRFGLITNVRDPSRIDPDAPSRGEIVPTWLGGSQPVDRFWTRTALSGHNGFNLIVADFASGECHYANNLGALPRRLAGGIHVLSNATLDTPWPKAQGLRFRMRSALNRHAGLEGLVEELFDALCDRHHAPDADLPSTGVPLEVERWLSAAFVRSPDRRYGTRASTLLVTERVERRLVTHVIERRFGPDGDSAVQRRVSLPGWPPDGRAATASATTAVEGPPPALLETLVPGAVRPLRAPVAMRTRAPSLAPVRRR